MSRWCLICSPLQYAIWPTGYRDDNGQSWGNRRQDDTIFLVSCGRIWYQRGRTTGLGIWCAFLWPSGLAMTPSQTLVLRAVSPTCRLSINFCAWNWNWQKLSLKVIETGGKSIEMDCKSTKIRGNPLTLPKMSVRDFAWKVGWKTPNSLDCDALLMCRLAWCFSNVLIRDEDFLLLLRQNGQHYPTIFCEERPVKPATACNKAQHERQRGEIILQQRGSAGCGSSSSSGTNDDGSNILEAA